MANTDMNVFIHFKSHVSYVTQFTNNKLVMASELWGKLPNIQSCQMLKLGHSPNILPIKISCYTVCFMSS